MTDLTGIGTEELRSALTTVQHLGQFQKPSLDIADWFKDQAEVMRAELDRRPSRSHVRREAGR